MLERIGNRYSQGQYLRHRFGSESILVCLQGRRLVTKMLAFRTKPNNYTYMNSKTVIPLYREAIKIKHDQNQRLRGFFFHEKCVLLDQCSNRARTGPLPTAADRLFHGSNTLPHTGRRFQKLMVYGTLPTV